MHIVVCDVFKLLCNDCLFSSSQISLNKCTRMSLMVLYASIFFLLVFYCSLISSNSSSLFNLPGSLSFWSAILIQTIPCFLSLTFSEICRIFYLSVVFLKAFRIVQGNVPSSLPVQEHRNIVSSCTLQARELFLRSP